MNSGKWKKIVAVSWLTNVIIEILNKDLERDNYLRKLSESI